MRALPALALLLPLAAWCQAQPVENARPSQKIERLVHEDNGNRIEEVRVGGQVQSVTVQPRGDAPAYELQPTDMARSRPADRREGLSGGGTPRVWNFLRF
jgi:starvation-inducible outer membrane lipoprotein